MTEVFYSQVCRRLEMALEDTYMAPVLHAIFNEGKGLTSDDVLLLDRLMSSETKRRVFLELLIEVKDIRRERIAFQLGTERIEDFEKWLDVDDDTIWEVEPKTPYVKKKT